MNCLHLALLYIFSQTLHLSLDKIIRRQHMSRRTTKLTKDLYDQHRLRSAWHQCSRSVAQFYKTNDAVDHLIWHNANIYAEKKKNVCSFCICTFFSKNTCELDIVLTKTVNILTVNELVKLTMLRTSGPLKLYRRRPEIATITEHGLPMTPRERANKQNWQYTSHKPNKRKPAAPSSPTSWPKC